MIVKTDRQTHSLYVLNIDNSFIDKLHPQYFTYSMDSVLHFIICIVPTTVKIERAIQKSHVLLCVIFLSFFKRTRKDTCIRLTYHNNPKNVISRVEKVIFVVFAC